MTTSEFNKIGVIGLGIIGKGIADVLRRSDCEVYVWNRTPKPEPNFLASPAEIARIANLIQVFVTDGAALLSVMEQMKEHLTPDHVVMGHATVEPGAAVEACEMARSAGADYLDAPFTGSRNAAAAGNLVYYIGGDRGTLERVRPALELSAQEILPVGKVGDAAVIKIATNMISAATVGVLSEAYGLTVKAGIDPAVLQRAIESNACGSVLTSMKLPSMIAANYEPHFSLKNMFKDSQFAVDLARHFAIEIPVLTTTANVMYRALQKGRADLDFSSVAIDFQETSGTSPE